MHLLHFVLPQLYPYKYQCLLRLQTIQCKVKAKCCSQDHYPAKVSWARPSPTKSTRTCIYIHTYLHTHTRPEVVLYIVKRAADLPANHVAALWWLIGSTQWPHTISQREEKPPSILIFSLSSIFISSFIFIAGCTEQIRELCEHFCRSLFEMEDCHGLTDIDTLLCLHVASNVPPKRNRTEHFWGCCRS